MTSTLSSLRTLPDRDLLAQLERAVGQERQATAHLIALLMEADARKLYATQSCSSLFTYCVQVLHLSEHASYLRIEAARAARRFPVILERLADGSVHLTAISLLAPHFTVTNHIELLAAAHHKSKRAVEQRSRYYGRSQMSQQLSANSQRQGKRWLLRRHCRLRNERRADPDLQRTLPPLRRCGRQK